MDVQNCFLEHFGSYGWNPADPKLKLETDREKIIEEYKRRLKDLLDNKKQDYDIIIFTKDNHPLGHKSFNNEQGIHPPHCIDLKKKFVKKVNMLLTPNKKMIV